MEQLVDRLTNSIDRLSDSLDRFFDPSLLLSLQHSIQDLGDEVEKLRKEGMPIRDGGARGPRQTG